MRESNRERHRDKKKEGQTSTPGTHFWAVQRARFELKKNSNHTLVCQLQKAALTNLRCGPIPGGGVLPYNFSMDKDVLLKVDLIFLPFHYQVQKHISEVVRIGVRKDI